MTDSNTERPNTNGTEAAVAPMPAEPFVGYAEAAAHFGICRRTLQALVSDGVVRYLEIGAAKRFRLSEVEDDIRENSGAVKRALKEGKKYGRAAKNGKA